jgi:hypothetical protein
MLGELRFLYVGAGDTGAAVDWYVANLGARLRWRFQHFGADVAAVSLRADGRDQGDGDPETPLVLLTDHRPAGSVLPIYAVDDLAACAAQLRASGAHVVGPMGTPEGDAVVVETPGGVELALLEVVRPGAMDRAYADPGNTHRVK